MSRPTLDPCHMTGQPCRWLSEEWYGDDGEMTAWDNYCGDCFEWRDWSMDECVLDANGVEQ